MSEFAGKVAVVTGAAGGIGTDVVRRMNAAGFNVVATDMDRQGSESLARELGDTVLFQSHDVTSEAGWSAVMAAAEQRFGGVDALVNCAGYFKPHIHFLDTSLEEWRKHFAINSDSVFLGCRFGIEAMRKRGGGAIVNFSSGLALRVIESGAAYCAAKTAILATTRLAAQAGGPHKVRVNALLPGAIETPMLYRNVREGQDPQALVELYTKQHPIGRIGTPTDISEFVLFLCSDRAGFITGAALPIDGGQTA